MKRKNICKLLDEGFVNSGKTSGTYHIYEKETLRAFYCEYKDKIICKFDLNDLMNKL